MSPKKGDRVSVPPLDGWNVVFGTTEATIGWDELCRVALPSAHRCLVSMETSTVILVYASPQHPKDTE